MADRQIKAVIPAAGFGTRFLPLTKAQPKEMLPVVNKPTIQWVVEEAVDAGIKDIAIITGKHKKAIENHFNSAKELEEVLEKAGKIKELEEIKSKFSVKRKKQFYKIFKPSFFGKTATINRNQFSTFKHFKLTENELLTLIIYLAVIKY